MPPLPKADLAFVNADGSPMAVLGQASRNAGGADLPSCDQVGGSLHFVAPLSPQIELRTIKSEEYLLRDRNYTKVFV